MHSPSIHYDLNSAAEQISVRFVVRQLLFLLATGCLLPPSCRLWCRSGHDTSPSFVLRLSACKRSVSQVLVIAARICIDRRQPTMLLLSKRLPRVMWKPAPA
jgi:hypothetical protein